MESDLESMSTLTTAVQPLEDKTLENKYIDSKKFLMKKYNFNEYGRYKGGYPNRWWSFRGNAQGRPGEFHDVVDLRDYEKADMQTDFKINREDVVDYGRYMQDDMSVILNKRTYIAGKLDENYFSVEQFSLLGKIVAFVIVFSTFRFVYLQLLRRSLAKPSKNVRTLEIE